jgi:hypothetical protein
MSDEINPEADQTWKLLLLFFVSIAIGLSAKHLLEWAGSSIGVINIPVGVAVGLLALRLLTNLFGVRLKMPLFPFFRQREQ